ncbi:MAG: hypothetical protein LBI87_07960 [Candidatus Accumulibacter sp.]|jgi:hypothetical protein|nr:hypothetical protein [Accumulibacter sp.]
MSPSRPALLLSSILALALAPPPATASGIPAVGVASIARRVTNHMENIEQCVRRDDELAAQ